MFKKMLASVGVGGASVDTVLTDPNCRPGEALAGVCRVVGGKVAQTVDAIDVELVAKVEVEYQSDGEDREYLTTMEFASLRVAERFEIAPGQHLDIPFRLPVPWETPLTTHQGRHLTGMSVSVRTSVDIARAKDAGDLDPVAVHPLASQDLMLTALGRLGFRFRGADVEKGPVPGGRLPFHQEIEFHPSDEFRSKFRELELTFVAGPGSMEVLFEVDKKGIFSGGDQVTRFTVPYGQEDADWEGILRGHLTEMGRRRGWF